MPIGLGAKLYRSLLRSLVEEGAAKNTKHAVQLARHVRRQLEQIKPEAFEGMREMLYVKDLGYRGEYLDGDILLSDKGLKGITFGHEVGHHLHHPLGPVKEGENPFLRDISRDFEDDANAFATVLARRIKRKGRGVELTKEESDWYEKWLYGAAGISTGALLAKPTNAAETVNQTLNQATGTWWPFGTTLEKAKPIPSTTKEKRHSEMLRVLGLTARGKPKPILSARDELYETYPVLTKEGTKHYVKGTEPLTEQEYSLFPSEVRQEIESFFGEVHENVLKDTITPVDAMKLQKELGLKDPAWYMPTPADMVGGVAAGMRLGGSKITREILGEVTLGLSEAARAIPPATKALGRATRGVRGKLGLLKPTMFRDRRGRLTVELGSSSEPGKGVGIDHWDPREVKGDIRGTVPLKSGLADKVSVRSVLLDVPDEGIRPTAEEIDRLLKPGGSIEIYDSQEVINPYREFFKKRGYTEKRTHHRPSEFDESVWEDWVLTKPKEPSAAEAVWGALKKERVKGTPYKRPKIEEGFVTSKVPELEATKETLSAARKQREATVNYNDAYDFGGGDMPVHPNVTVVDTVPSPSGTEKYIQADLSKPLNLPPKGHVNLKWAIHEFPSETAYDNVYRSIKTGGTLHVEDEAEAVEPLVKYLEDRGMKVTSRLKDDLGEGEVYLFVDMVKPKGLGEVGSVASDIWPGETFTAAGRQLMEAIKTPSFIQRTWGHKNLREMIIPRVEDMEKEARILFREYRVGKSERQGIIKEATDPLWDLTSKEHEFALNYLTIDNDFMLADTLGIPKEDIYSSQWKKARDAAVKVRNVYRKWGLEATELSKKTGEAMLKKETYLKNLATYLPDMAMVKEYPELFGPSMINLDNPINRKKFRADLSRFMNNKGIIKAHKEEMLQILDLKYLTTKSFRQMSEDIETAKLFQRLEELPGYVFNTMDDLKQFQNQFRESFERAGIDIEEGLKKIGLHTSQFNRIPKVDKALTLAGKLVRRDVAAEIEDMSKVASEFGRLFEKLLAPWKFGKVVLRFPTHARNIMSNWILNDIGGLPFYRLDYYTKALGQMKGKGEMYQLAKKKGLLLATFREHELLKLSNSWDEKSGFIGLLGKITKPASDLYQAEEQWFKLAKFMYHMDNEVKRGVMDIDDAIEAAMESTFDYGTSTAFQRTIKRTIMPFATWTFKSVPFLAKQAVEHPIRVGKWPLMFYGVSHYSAEKLLGSDEEWKRMQGMMAEYQKNKSWLLLPVRDEKGRLQPIDLTYILPWGDVAEIGQQGLKRVIQNPAVTITYDLLKNRDFMDRKIYEDWERGTKDQYLKQAKHVYKQLAPSSFPGSWDWEKMTETFGEGGRRKPGVMTPSQAVMYNLGLKVSPMTKRGVTESFENRYERMQGEMETQFNRDIKREPRSQERNKIRRKYRENVRRLEEEYRQQRRGR